MGNLSMSLLVCGGRDFENLVWAFERLDQFKVVSPVMHVIHIAARDADTIGEEWAKLRGIPFTPFPSDWDRLRNAAGPIWPRSTVKVSSL